VGAVHTSWWVAASSARLLALAGLIIPVSLCAAVANAVLQGRTLESELPPTTPGVLRSIMVRCWRADPNERPTMADVVAKLRRYVSRCPYLHLCWLV